MYKHYDIIIIGAGIVGLSVAREIIRRDHTLKIAILEKEEQPGIHASGRNSGVLHCGIYYSADTMKAKLCALGANRMLQYAKEEGIRYDNCGKVILATSEAEIPTLNKLLKNAKENDIPAQSIDEQQLREIEPFAAPGFGAIYCSTTSIIDSKAIVARLHEQLKQQGVTFFFNCQVKGISRSQKRQLRTTQGTFSYGFLYNCAGAYATVIANHFNVAKDYALIPFKGIYWKLNPELNQHVRANIYPVPDVSMPFLGVHLTRVISGDVYVGPTAIPALGRENYGIFSGIKVGEATPLLLKLLRMYVADQNSFRKLAHVELSKYRKSVFLKAAQKLVPSVRMDGMLPCNKVGIRPQLINTKTNKLEMDYILQPSDNELHVLNAISPAFTSAFAFAEMIVTAGKQ